MFFFLFVFCGTIIASPTPMPTPFEASAPKSPTAECEYVAPEYKDSCPQLHLCGSYGSCVQPNRLISRVGSGPFYMDYDHKLGSLRMYPTSVSFSSNLMAPLDCEYKVLLYNSTASFAMSKTPYAVLQEVSYGEELMLNIDERVFIVVLSSNYGSHYGSYSGGCRLDFGRGELIDEYERRFAITVSIFSVVAVLILVLAVYWEVRRRRKPLVPEMDISYMKHVGRSRLHFLLAGLFIYILGFLAVGLGLDPQELSPVLGVTAPITVFVFSFVVISVVFAKTDKCCYVTASAVFLLIFVIILMIFFGVWLNFVLHFGSPIDGVHGAASSQTYSWSYSSKCFGPTSCEVEKVEGYASYDLASFGIALGIVGSVIALVVSVLMVRVYAADQKRKEGMPGVMQGGLLQSLQRRGVPRAPRAVKDGVLYCKLWSTVHSKPSCESFEARTRKELRDHYLKEHRALAQRCTVASCGKVFADKHSLSTHVNKKHLFTCQQCDVFRMTSPTNPMCSKCKCVIQGALPSLSDNSTPADVLEKRVGSECSICLESLEQAKPKALSYLPVCKHVFHATCITEWLGNKFRESGKSVCPICNVKMK